MKTKSKYTNNAKEPEALTQVWQWKEAVYQQTKEMSSEDLIKHFKKVGDVYIKKLGLKCKK